MTWNSTALAIFAAREPIAIRTALWVAAKELSDGSPAPIGIWTGDDNATMTIEGESRDYFGAQGTIEFEPMRYVPGTEIGSTTIDLSQSPEVEDLIRGYTIRFVPAEIHSILLDPDTYAFVAANRVFKGFVDGAGITTPALNGVAGAGLRLVSSARMGTMTETGRKSDQAQRLRAGDRFRRYGDLGVVASDPWGAKAADQSAGTGGLLSRLIGNSRLFNGRLF